MKDYRDNSILLNDVYTIEENKEEIIDDLMTTYSQKVFLLAYSFVKDHGIAEDISQEVFIKCYRNLHKFRGESSISSWIYRITANTAKDFLRKKKIMDIITIRSMFENKEEQESVEATYIKFEKKEKVLQSVLSLPIKYREILVLYYFHEQKIDEIAHTLHFNSNTVRTRLSRGREKLKQKLTSVEREAL